MRSGLCCLPVLAVMAFSPSVPALAEDEVTILNVSYDPTRELYEEFNQAFAKHWKSETGQKVTVRQSHGGAGKQARVRSGLPIGARKKFRHGLREFCQKVSL